MKPVYWDCMGDTGKRETTVLYRGKLGFVGVYIV